MTIVSLLLGLHGQLSLILLLSVLLTLVASSKEDNNTIGGARQISIRIPDLRPDHGEQYLCMSHRVSLNEATNSGESIVGFRPYSDAHRVHHMLLYGCELPGILQPDSPNFVWDCGSMHQSGEAPERSFEAAPVCRGRTQILYGWAMEAPALKLPPGVGFELGGPSSKINYLVLQVHYGHHEPFEQTPELTDNSGLLLDVETRTLGRRAGVLLMSSTGVVPVGRSKHEIWCTLDDNGIEIHPFRYRVHTHQLGVKVLAAKIGADQGRGSARGLKVDRAEIIGVGDPREPQMFHPIERNVVLRPGDKIYASCEFNNNRSHPVSIGQTGEDEMCNFYLMYWTDSPRLLRDNNCLAQNPASLFDSWIGALLE